MLRYASARPTAPRSRSVGAVVEHDARKAALRVRAGRGCARWSRTFLLDPALLDLTIEDPPLEEVMRELFAALAANGAT